RRSRDDVSLAVAAGAFCALRGPCGSGRSTVVKAVGGVRRAGAGTVTVEGRATARLGRRELATVVGYVPQAGDAPSALTVREAVMLGRTPHFGLSPRAQAPAAADAAIGPMGRVDLPGHATPA